MYLDVLRSAAREVHDGERWGIRSSGMYARLAPECVVDVWEEEGKLLARWTWREARTIHKLRHLPLLLAPLRGSVACTMDVTYSSSTLDVTIEIWCRAFDLFAIALRERVEQRLAELARDEMHLYALPYYTSRWEETIESEVEKWREVFDDTRPLHKPSRTYHYSKRTVHRFARRRVKDAERLRGLDKPIFEYVGSGAIVPKVLVSIKPAYRWISQRRIHQAVRHDPQEPTD